ncbi:Sialic acid transporter NanT [Streptomyces fumanus]
MVDAKPGRPVGSPGPDEDAESSREAAPAGPGRADPSAAAEQGRLPRGGRTGRRGACSNARWAPPRSATAWSGSTSGSTATSPPPSARCSSRRLPGRPAHLLVRDLRRRLHSGPSLGGLRIGPLGDRIGRQKVLATTMIMMAAGTFAIGLIPSYATIGIAAPVLLLLARMVQGFSTGGEYGGATTFVAEYSPDRRRGFLSSWLDFGTFVGYALGSALVTVLNLAGAQRRPDALLGLAAALPDRRPAGRHRPLHADEAGGVPRLPAATGRAREEPRAGVGGQRAYPRHRPAALAAAAGLHRPGAALQRHQLHGHRLPADVPDRDAGPLQQLRRCAGADRDAVDRGADHLPRPAQRPGGPASAVRGRRGGDDRAGGARLPAAQGGRHGRAGPRGAAAVHAAGLLRRAERRHAAALFPTAVRSGDGIGFNFAVAAFGGTTRCSPRPWSMSRATTWSPRTT